MSPFGRRSSRKPPSEGQDVAQLMLDALLLLGLVATIAAFAYLILGG